MNTHGLGIIRVIKGPKVIHFCKFRGKNKLREKKTIGWPIKGIFSGNQQLVEAGLMVGLS